jgi:hypothetical protein
MKVTVWLVDEGDVDNVDDDDNELMMLMRDESIVTVFVRG